jgi:hypothetical protein
MIYLKKCGICFAVLFTALALTDAFVWADSDTPDFRWNLK